MLKRHHLLCVMCALALGAFCSCGPMTADSYMRQYEEFVDELADNFRTYSDADWDRQSKRYDKFTGPWYARVEDQLSMSQKLEAHKLTCGAGLVFSYKYGKDVAGALVGLAEDFVGMLADDFSDAVDDLDEAIDDVDDMLDAEGDE